ncbi:MAG: hypothetical protein V1834_02830 [Candidatus Micrarchaeota archaeon]
MPERLLEFMKDHGLFLTRVRGVAGTESGSKRYFPGLLSEFRVDYEEPDAFKKDNGTKRMNFIIKRASDKRLQELKEAGFMVAFGEYERGRPFIAIKHEEPVTPGKQSSLERFQQALIEKIAESKPKSEDGV